MSCLQFNLALANHTSWPQQGRQTSAALNHLLQKGISPGSIIIAGDSVGAHQVAFLLSHILNPHPRVQPIESLKYPLAGALLISPWASFEEYAPSFKLNATADVMTVPGLRRWANVLKSSRELGEDELPPGYFEPEKAELEWWAGLSSVVNRVLLTTGGLEVLVDDAVSLGKKMQMGSSMGQKGIEIFVEKDVGHNESITECATGDRPGPTTNRIIDWIGNL
jgi:acetyl esterase/lipase